MKKLLLRIVRWGAVLLVGLAIGLVGRGVYAFRDRTPGYALDLKIDAAKSRAEPRPLQVGFARIKINPDLSDPRPRKMLCHRCSERPSSSGDDHRLFGEVDRPRGRFGRVHGRTQRVSFRAVSAVGRAPRKRGLPRRR